MTLSTVAPGLFSSSWNLRDAIIALLTALTSEGVPLIFMLVALPTIQAAIAANMTLPSRLRRSSLSWVGAGIVAISR